MKKGFTLIELLVVVSIIGILATVVLASLNKARMKARDSKVITEMKNLETGLELYYLDNGHYPTLWVQTWTGGDMNVTNFLSTMEPYMDIDLFGDYYNDPSGGNNAIFFYRSKSANNYQTYGMMVKLEDSALGAEDDGYWSNFYELGQDPKYCKDKYPTGTDGDWWQGGGSQRCYGG